jgi:hypothetical protein
LTSSDPLALRPWLFHCAEIILQKGVPPQSIYPLFDSELTTGYFKLVLCSRSPSRLKLLTLVASKRSNLPTMGEAPNMSLTNCRFYEEKYPEIESFVMVNVKQV